MAETKAAFIDLGTNTFHLVIASCQQQKISIIARDRVAVKIGAGGINQGVILEPAIDRAIATMKKFRGSIDHHGVKDVFAFGTSALRSAKNGAEVAARITMASGIQISIISGDEEAALIYRGVSEAVRTTTDRVLTVDIGGGSVEFIIGFGKKIEWKQSIEIGAQRMLEKFQKHDPILPEEIAALDNYLDSELKQVVTAVKTFLPSALVGASGSFDTLSEMYCAANNLPYNEADPETPLTIESFYESFDHFKTKNRFSRLQLPGMIEMRVDMITTACCLIDYLLSHHHFDTIRVSTWSLKEGALNQWAERTIC